MQFNSKGYIKVNSAESSTEPRLEQRSNMNGFESPLNRIFTASFIRLFSTHVEMVHAEALLSQHFSHYNFGHERE